MTLTQQNIISMISILEDGQIQVRQSHRIFDDAEQLTEKYHRFVLEPGQTVTQYPKRLRDICALIWTPQVIADFQATKSAQVTSLI